MTAPVRKMKSKSSDATSSLPSLELQKRTVCWSRILKRLKIYSFVRLGQQEPNARVNRLRSNKETKMKNTGSNKLVADKTYFQLYNPATGYFDMYTILGDNTVELVCEKYRKHN